MPRALLRKPDYSKLACWLLTFLVSSHCSSLKGVKSNDTDKALKAVRSAVRMTMQNSVAKRSQNTRTYFSKYHAPGKNVLAGFVGKKHRAQLIMTILGDRRPYKVSILYRVERKNDGGVYKFNNHDKNLARYYRDKFTDHLASRPDDRDVIDDFRPY